MRINYRDGCHFCGNEDAFYTVQVSRRIKNGFGIEKMNISVCKECKKSDQKEERLMIFLFFVFFLVLASPRIKLWLMEL